MSARYFSGLSVRWAAFLKSGNASRQRPFDAKLMPCSAEDEASGIFEGTCAEDKSAGNPDMQKTRKIQRNLGMKAKSDAALRAVYPPFFALQRVTEGWLDHDNFAILPESSVVYTISMVKLGLEKSDWGQDQ